MADDSKIYKKGAEKAAFKFGFIKAGPDPDKITKNIEPSTLEQIFTGWGNYVKSHFVDLSPALKEQGEKRLKICDMCDMRSGGTCSTKKQGKHKVTGKMTPGCGCRLAAKALSPGSRCPLGKW